MRPTFERTRTPTKGQTGQMSTMMPGSSPQRNKSALASRGMETKKDRSDNKENGRTSSPRVAGFSMKVSPFNQTLGSGDRTSPSTSPRRSMKQSPSSRKSVFTTRDKQGRQLKLEPDEPTEQ